MKILTNIGFVQVAGIAQNLASFINFIEHRKRSRIRIAGVEVVSNGKKPQTQKSAKGRFSLISKTVAVPSIIDTVKQAETVADIKRAYQEVIAAYRDAIKQERPDVILINGTHYLPWCLLLASQQFSIPVLLHYHGSITKETEHWKEQKPRELFRRMEQQFDNKKIFYIFPSRLIKNVVESEIFGHSIKRYSILPNPVPIHFFATKPSGKRKRIGIVGRWTRIKNLNFIHRLAQYNAKHGSEFSLHIVSDLPPNSKPRKTLSGLAIFKRPMNTEKLSRFYASMGIVLSPSHFETYGNVAKEAISSGTPALVSPQMGVAETFRELGLDGWITEFRSVRDVYAKIKEISGQPIRETVRKHLRNHHGAEHIHKRMVSIIKSI